MINIIYEHGMAEGMRRVIAHIDMDCFFCACEVKKDPSLKGKAVIVGSTGNRGVVSAASYEARKYGVFSAIPISTARRQCPDGVFLPVDKDLYREESANVMSILSRFSDTMRQMSVDEAFLDLTEMSKGFKSLEAMAGHIKKTLETETGLSCSIGVADSTIVAKIASDHNKPSGITVVHDTARFLEDLPISKVPGIGKLSEESYQDKGIEHVGDFKKKSNAELYQHFGASGLFYKRLALGEFSNTIEQDGPRKSVSRETTLEKDTHNIIELEKEIMKLCKEVHEDLEGGFFKTVSIKIRYSDFSTMTRDQSFKTPSNSIDSVSDTALALFRRTITSKTDVRLLGVKLGNIEEHGQMTLTAR